MSKAKETKSRAKKTSAKKEQIDKEIQAEEAMPETPQASEESGGVTEEAGGVTYVFQLFAEDPETLESFLVAEGEVLANRIEQARAIIYQNWTEEYANYRPQLLLRTGKASQ